MSHEEITLEELGRLCLTPLAPDTADGKKKSFSSVISSLAKTVICFVELTCPRSWDGVMCWPSTLANTTSHQPCASYVNGFNPLVNQ